MAGRACSRWRALPGGCDPSTRPRRIQLLLFHVIRPGKHHYQGSRLYYEGINTSTSNDRAVDVRFSQTRMYVRLVDDREIGVPLAWFPHLLDATSEQRVQWRLIGEGVGIH